MTETWEQRLERQNEAHTDEYLELLAIPSVSTDPERKPDMQRAAEFISARLTRAGVPEVTIAQSDGHPAVIGRWHVDDAQPTILIYGHYDVQPAEPLELWESPPFEPKVDGDVVTARGSSDMKGNLLTAIYGVEAVAQANGGTPPINVSFIFEGEEEIGSPHLQQIIEANRELLQADAVISADGGQFGPETPEMGVALKGLAGLQVDLTTTNVDMHSGMYGAWMPNAVQSMVQLAATLHDAEGHVLVKGFYDDVQDLSDDEREEVNLVPIDEAAELRDLGAKALWGPSEFTPRERQWARPTLDLNGIWGGFQGEGTKTVTPSKAHLKVTCRLVPNQDPKKIVELLKAHFTEHCPTGATVGFVLPKGAARPYAVDRANPVYSAVEGVVTELYGNDPVIVRSGGTVPATGIFQDVMGIDTITMGWSEPGSRAHAPNEWYLLSDLLRGRKGYAMLVERLKR